MCSTVGAVGAARTGLTPANFPFATCYRRPQYLQFVSLSDIRLPSRRSSGHSLSLDPPMVGVCGRAWGSGLRSLLHGTGGVSVEGPTSLVGEAAGGRFGWTTLA